jgi:hypothetical protein
MEEKERERERKTLRMCERKSFVKNPFSTKEERKGLKFPVFFIKDYFLLFLRGREVRVAIMEK